MNKDTTTFEPVLSVGELCMGGFCMNSSKLGFISGKVDSPSFYNTFNPTKDDRPVSLKPPAEVA